MAIRTDNKITASDFNNAFVNLYNNIVDRASPFGAISATKISNVYSGTLISLSTINDCISKLNTLGANTSHNQYSRPMRVEGVSGKVTAIGAYTMIDNMSDLNKNLCNCYWDCLCDSYCYCDWDCYCDGNCYCDSVSEPRECGDCCDSNCDCDSNWCPDCYCDANCCDYDCNCDYDYCNSYVIHSGCYYGDGGCTHCVCDFDCYCYSDCCDGDWSFNVCYCDADCCEYDCCDYDCYCDAVCTCNSDCCDSDCTCDSDCCDWDCMCNGDGYLPTPPIDVSKYF